MLNIPIKSYNNRAKTTRYINEINDKVTLQNSAYRYYLSRIFNVKHLIKQNIYNC